MQKRYFMDLKVGNYYMSGYNEIVQLVEFNILANEINYIVIESPFIRSNENLKYSYNIEDFKRACIVSANKVETLKVLYGRK